MNIQELWDYAFELLNEISDLISSLPSNKFISSNSFIDINHKIQKAKEIWVNVSKYENEIKDFRIKLLQRKIQEQLDNIQQHMKSQDLENLDLQYEDIENNFIELKQDFNYIPEVEDMYYQLKNTIKKAKIYRKIVHFHQQDTASNFDFDQMMCEILSLKEAWIDVTDLEDMIMWD